MKNTLKLISIILSVLCALCLFCCSTKPQAVTPTATLDSLYYAYRHGAQAFIDVDGNLYTWGADCNNNRPEGSTGSQLGQGSSVLYNNVPTVIAQNVSDVYYISKALTQNGDLLAWGLRNGKYLETPQVERSSIKAYGTVWYLTDTGELYGCYEAAGTGQNPPYGEEDLLVMKDVVDCWWAAYVGYLALKEDGSLWNFKMTTYMTVEVTMQPVRIMTDVEKMIYAGGAAATLLLKTDGSLWTLGNNEYGACGNGEHGDYDRKEAECLVTEPYRVMDGIKDAWGCWSTCYALKEDGTLYGWGLNDYDVLLTGCEITSPMTSNRAVETQPIKVMEKVKAVFPGSDGCFVIREDGSLWSWGTGNRGTLGNGVKTHSEDLNSVTLSIEAASQPITCEPQKILDDVTRVLGVETGGALIFAEKKDGSVWYWGIDEIITDEDGDWDTYNKTYNYYSRHEIIATPQPFDISTFHQGLGSKSK